MSIGHNLSICFELKDNLNSLSLIEFFLNDLAKYLGESPTSRPVLLERKIEPMGISGSLLTNNLHLSIHTFKKTDEITVQIFSFVKQLTPQIVTYISRKYNLPFDELEYDNSLNDNEITECQEPRCRVPAIKEWNGLKVCRDHYEEHEENQNRIIHDMNRY